MMGSEPDGYGPRSRRREVDRSLSPFYALNAPELFQKQILCNSFRLLVIDSSILRLDLLIRFQISEVINVSQKGNSIPNIHPSIHSHPRGGVNPAEIAAESSNTEVGLYYHYDSKDALVVAFLESATGFLRRQLEELEAADPASRLREACGRLFAKFDDESRRRTNIAVMELLAHAPHNETLHGPRLKLESSNLTVLEGIVEDGIEQGVFREVDSRGVAAFLLTDDLSRAAHLTGMRAVDPIAVVSGRVHVVAPTGKHREVAVRIRAVELGYPRHC